jgi:hypothetical protein
MNELKLIHSKNLQKGERKMFERSIYEDIDSFLNYDDIVDEVCSGYFQLNYEDYNTKNLIHLFIFDEDMQILFIKDDICFRNKLEKEIRYLTK